MMPSRQRVAVLATVLTAAALSNVVGCAASHRTSLSDVDAGVSDAGEVDPTPDATVLPDAGPAECIADDEYRGHIEFTTGGDPGWETVTNGVVGADCDAGSIYYEAHARRGELESAVRYYFDRDAARLEAGHTVYPSLDWDESCEEDYPSTIDPNTLEHVRCSFDGDLVDLGGGFWELRGDLQLSWPEGGVWTEFDGVPACSVDACARPRPPRETRAASSQATGLGFEERPDVAARE